MPFVLLGLILVVAVVLYLTFAQNEGDPSLKPRPFWNIGGNAAQTADNDTDNDGGDKGGHNTEQEKPSTINDESAASDKKATSADKNTDQNTETQKSFQSMEELTEFYRREAEKLTGIKH